jgi:hypothetical protein
LPSSAEPADYAKLRGQGDFCVADSDEGGVEETFTGRFRLR